MEYGAGRDDHGSAIENQESRGCLLRLCHIQKRAVLSQVLPECSRHGSHGMVPEIICPGIDHFASPVRYNDEVEPEIVVDPRHQIAGGIIRLVPVDERIGVIPLPLVRADRGER